MSDADVTGTDFGEGVWTTGGYPTGGYVAMEDRLALIEQQQACNAH